MNKFVVDLSKGSFQLKKSARLIGVKLNDESPKAKIPKFLQPKKIAYQWLGGFRIYKVGGGFKKIESFLNKLRKHKDVALATHVYHAIGDKKPIVPTGKVQVSFDSDATKKSKKELMKSLNLKLHKERRDDLWVVSITKDSPNPMKTAIALKKSEIVSFAVPFFDSPLDLYEEVDKPSNMLYLDQWYLNNTGGNKNDPKGKFVKGSDLNIPEAWKLLGNRGSSKIKVAVVDSGFDLSHPDYKDKIVAPFSLFLSNDYPLPEQGGSSTHGTECSGLAIANSKSGGMIGVAPNSQFMPVEGTTYNPDSLERVLDHCIVNGADIISCSWGSVQPQYALNEEHMFVIENAAKRGRNGKGCIILFAVGNEDAEYINHYATHPNVIAVAGSTSADGHFRVSNRGREISVSAPAGNFPLITTRAGWDTGNSILPGESEDFRYWWDGKSRGESGLYKHFEGTSAACPLVAGVCALILSANPKLTAMEVKEILELTADKIGNKNDYENGFSLRFGYGRVNAARAVEEALRRKNDPNSTGRIKSGKTYKVTSKVEKISGYGIQVGLFMKYKNVLSYTDKIQQLFSEPVFMKEVKYFGGTAFRMVLGGFKTRSEARNFLDKVKAKGINGYVIKV